MMRLSKVARNLEPPKNLHDFLEPAPHTKMWVAFHKVIDYLMYRLRDRRSILTDAEGIAISQLKRKLYGLYPTLKTSNGTVTIFFLKFIATLAQSLDSVGTSEAAAVCTLMKYLEYEAKEVHNAQISDVDEDLAGATQPPHSSRTWSFVVDVLMR